MTEQQEQPDVETLTLDVDRRDAGLLVSIFEAAADGFRRNGAPNEIPGRLTFYAAALRLQYALAAGERP